MTTQLSNDPLSLLERNLWFAAESHPGVTALVRLANRARMVAQGVVPAQDNPLKDSLLTTDLPELTLFAMGGEPDAVGQGVSSSTVGMVQRFGWGLSTDEIRTDMLRSLNPLKWALLNAMWRVKYGAASVLPFVNLIIVRNVSDQVQDPSQKDRDVAGWKCLVSVECRLVFDRSLVTA